MVTIKQASIAKKCNIQFRGKPEGCLPRPQKRRTCPRIKGLLYTHDPELGRPLGILLAASTI
jgi:hypothetical protein